MSRALRPGDPVAVTRDLAHPCPGVDGSTARGEAEIAGAGVDEIRVDVHEVVADRGVSGLGGHRARRTVKDVVPDLRARVVRAADSQHGVAVKSVVSDQRVGIEPEAQVPTIFPGIVDHDVVDEAVVRSVRHREAQGRAREEVAVVGVGMVVPLPAVILDVIAGVGFEDIIDHQALVGGEIDAVVIDPVRAAVVDVAVANLPETALAGHDPGEPTIANLAILERDVVARARGAINAGPHAAMPAVIKAPINPDTVPGDMMAIREELPDITPSIIGPDDHGFPRCRLHRGGSSGTPRW